MKVLQINSVCKSGSTGKIAYDLHTSLIADGHESIICYGRGSVLEEDNIYKISNEWGVKIHALMARVIGVNGLASNWSTNKLIKKIEEFKPDVVHIHNLHGYYVNMYRVIRYLKKKNIKTIWTLHDDLMFTGNCGGYYLCEKWKNECHKCEYIREYPKSIYINLSKAQYYLKKSIFREFNNVTFVSPSKWLGDKVKQSILKDKVLEIIPNGIDVKNIFYPKDYTYLKKRHGIVDEKIILSVMPNFDDERKGGKYIIDLANEMKNEKVKFIIIGVNNSLEDFPDNIIAIKRTEDQEELARYYSMADVFVITSRCENLPTVCIEALACNALITGFNVGGVRECSVSNEEKLASYGDLEELKKIVLENLMRDKDIYNKKEIFEKFSKEKMYKEYMKIYNRKDIKKDEKYAYNN